MSYVDRASLITVASSGILNLTKTLPVLDLMDILAGRDGSSWWAGCGTMVT